MTSAREALTVAAAVGGYFEVEQDPGPEWTTLGELISVESLLADQVELVRAGLAQQRGLATEAIDLRPAASVWFLGTVCRLLSPVFGAAVLADVVPRCTLSSVRWRAVDESTGATSNRLRISIDDVGGLTGTVEGMARAVQTEVLATVVAPLVLACGTAFQVSEKILWGNVSSALAGANIVLDSTRPATSKPALELLRDIVETGKLKDTGKFTRRGFVRNSCCLIYRVPRCSYCGDCVLLDRPE